MNAPAQIQRKSKRDDYIPQVQAFVPLCRGEELTLRCSILLMRDMATAKMRECSEEAGGILEQIQRLASAYAYAAIPTDRLSELRRTLLNLTASASTLEMFAYHLAYPDGGTDAGG